MAHQKDDHIRDLQNRIEQLEGLHNARTNADFYEKLAAGKTASASPDGSVSPNGLGVQYIPVPITLKAQLGSPTALAIGAFATTLTALSFALMQWPGLTITNAFIGDFFGVARIGMVVTAQWELVLGNFYAYTVFSAFGLFYAGFGFIITPFFGVAASYEGGAASAGYNNALGFFDLMWAALNLFFLLGSLPLNLVYIGIFFSVQMAFTLLAASYFLTADGKADQAVAMKKAAGAFAFASGMLGWYTVANLTCAGALSFTFPMRDTSQFFVRGKEV